MGSIILILYPPLFLSSLPVSLTKAQLFHRSWIVIPIFSAAFAVSRHGPQHSIVCSLAVFKQRDLYSPGFVQTVAHVQYSGQFPAWLNPLSNFLSSVVTELHKREKLLIIVLSGNILILPAMNYFDR